jgi:uncharacterized protein YlxW (UPF0749 family)
MRKIIFFISFSLFISTTFAKEEKKDIIDQQKEMQKIQTEIKDNNKKLDSLKTIEIKIHKQLSDSDQKISTNI